MPCQTLPDASDGAINAWMGDHAASDTESLEMHRGVRSVRAGGGAYGEVLVGTALTGDGRTRTYRWFVGMADAVTGHFGRSSLGAPVGATGVGSGHNLEPTTRSERWVVCRPPNGQLEHPRHVPQLPLDVLEGARISPSPSRRSLRRPTGS